MDIMWGAATRPKEGQSINGDAYVVEQTRAGLLVSVIDGLGGGEEAAQASGAAATILRTYADQPLAVLMQQGHTALHGTRGAVIGIMRLQPDTRQVMYMGVGNIGVYVQSQQVIKPISKNGILGYRLPTLLQLSYTYNSGDTFVLYSDGISSSFMTEHAVDFRLPPQALADAIIAKYGKLNDDATVVVVRQP